METREFEKVAGGKKRFLQLSHRPESRVTVWLRFAEITVFAEINDWATREKSTPGSCEFGGNAPEAIRRVRTARALTAMSSASLVRAWREAKIWKGAYCRSLKENALLNEDIAFLRRELAAAHSRESALMPLARKRKHEKPPAAHALKEKEKKKKKRRKERLPSCVEADCGCCACNDCSEICSQCE